MQLYILRYQIFVNIFFIEILVQLILKAHETMNILVYCICVCSPNISFYKDLSLFALFCHLYRIFRNII